MKAEIISKIYLDNLLKFGKSFRSSLKDSDFMKRGRKSVRVGRGRAAVTGYETSKATLSYVMGKARQ